MQPSERVAGMPGKRVFRRLGGVWMVFSVEEKIVRVKLKEGLRPLGMKKVLVRHWRQENV